MVGILRSSYRNPKNCTIWPSLSNGEESEHTVRAGTYYARMLQSSKNRKEESRELLTKLLATSKQVLGPDHNTTTKDVELYLKESLQGFQTLAQMAVE